jgi:hypothetical protein
VGFEPTRVFSPTRFPIVLLKPLGHPSLPCTNRAKRSARTNASGEGGIRTHGRFRRHGLANRSLGPLGHLSDFEAGAVGFEPTIPGLTVRCFASSATPQYAHYTRRANGKRADRSTRNHLTLVASYLFFLKLPRQGSNLDFPDPESGVLPITPRGTDRSGRRGSNPRPSAWEADALPTELLPRVHAPAPRVPASWRFASRPPRAEH